MNTNDTAVKAWQEAEALKRFSLIAPLLREDLDEAKRIMLRKQIAEQNHISVPQKNYRLGESECLKKLELKNGRRSVARNIWS